MHDTTAYTNEHPAQSPDARFSNIQTKVFSLCGCGGDKSWKGTHHAEIVAIEEACRVRGGWRLPDCTLYVTLEPCPMCAGAIVNARVPRVVFGAYDPRAGAFGSAVDFNTLGLNHRPEITGGVLGEECAAVLREYFRKKR